MSLSNHGTINTGKDRSQKDYFYALKFEQVVKDGVEKVALNSIFGIFLRQMQKHAPEPLLVSDIHGVAVDFMNPMPEEGFKERFAVEVASARKKKMVMLGFHLEAKTPLSTLKKNMFDYLQKHGMFVRPHGGGFTHGVKTVILGYIGKENPATANVRELVGKVTKAMQDHWDDNNKWNAEERADFKNQHGFAVSPAGLSIPIVIERAKHNAQHDEKKVYADVLQVIVPSSHAAPAKILLDGAFLSQKLPEGYVPNGLRRENPELYYNLLREQAKWIHLHRNVQIQNVPANDALELKLFLENKKNNDIHRIYLDDQRNRLHVSTTAARFSEVQKWVHKEVNSRVMNYTPLVPTGKTYQPTTRSEYSKMFTAKTTTSDGSFDSTIKTAQPNAWYKTRQVPLVIDFSADAEAFPPLQSNRTPKEDEPTATSKISFSDETTIKTAVASAVQELETKYEKKLQDLSARLTAKLRKLEETISKFEDMDSKLDLIVDRLFDPDHGREPSLPEYGGYGPSATTPTRKTKRRDLKTTPRAARSKPHEVSPPHDDESTVMDFDADYQHDECSATSTTMLEGPHH